MTKLRAVLSAVVLALVTFSVAALPAAADDSAPITRYDVTADLTKEGVAKVSIDFTMDFSAVEGRGPYVILPTRQDSGDPKYQYAFDYSNISVSSSTGARTDVSLEEDGPTMSLRIGDKDVYNSTPQQYTVSYDVTGLIVSDQQQSGMDEFNWDVIGPGWESQISNVSVRVSGPAAVQKASCFRGPSKDQTPCEATSAGDTATFSYDGTLPPKNPMQIVAGFPAGTFGGVGQTLVRAPTLANAFELTPGTGSVAGAALVAGIAGLLVIRRRHARDEVYLGLTPGIVPGDGENPRVGTQSGKFPVTVQFSPPKGARPGEIGTLLDTTADDVDVTATMVDLAVRGYMRIESDGKKKFTLHATKAPAGQRMEPYENELLASIFRGASTRTSKELSKEKFAKVLPDARSGLYQSVVGKGWFKANPTQAQARPVLFGIVSVVAGLIFAFALAGIGWSLLGIPLVIFGIGLLVMSRKFRRRSAKGSAYLAQAKGFELYLRTAEKDTLQFEEGQDIFSKYLPYAMVFGVTDRWTKLFADLGAEGLYQADTSWYIGGDLMRGMYFSHAMSNLTSSMSSAMHAAQMDGVSQATGGSSGGSGFSGGGGFGGGGGGSW